MRTRWRAALLAAAALVSVPAAAQVVENNDTGTATETQERLAEGRGNDTPWDLLGLIGLLGLMGLKRDSDNDGYTDDPI
jgi:hypothetical protein